MNYNMHIETLDGTVIETDTPVTYPNQLNELASSMASMATDPQVYITVWKHLKGEVRKKYYSSACWGLETFALEMFDEMCKAHDWYYEYSDDHRVWTAGRAAEDRLTRRFTMMKKTYPAAAHAIWNSYCPTDRREAA